MERYIQQIPNLNRNVHDTVLFKFSRAHNVKSLSVTIAHVLQHICTLKWPTHEAY